MPPRDSNPLSKFCPLLSKATKLREANRRLADPDEISQYLLFTAEDQDFMWRQTWSSALKDESLIARVADKHYSDEADSSDKPLVQEPAYCVAAEIRAIASILPADDSFEAADVRENFDAMLRQRLYCWTTIPPDKGRSAHRPRAKEYMFRATYCVINEKTVEDFVQSVRNFSKTSQGTDTEWSSKADTKTDNMGKSQKSEKTPNRYLSEHAKECVRRLNLEFRSSRQKPVIRRVVTDYVNEWNLNIPSEQMLSVDAIERQIRQNKRMLNWNTK